MTGAEIAECLGMALSTVSAVLKRIGLGKLSRLDPPEPPNRYERRRRSPRGGGGGTCTSASRTPLAWPMSRFSPTRRRSPRPTGPAPTARPNASSRCSSLERRRDLRLQPRAHHGPHRLDRPLRMESPMRRGLRSADGRRLA
jgi:hypothetical protein